MLVRINADVQIENLRHYSPEIVESLRVLLAKGVDAEPDLRRKNFYDVHNCSRVFFIHVSPISGKVMLLASWLKDDQAAAAGFCR